MEEEIARDLYYMDKFSQLLLIKIQLDLKYILYPFQYVLSFVWINWNFTKCLNYNLVLETEMPHFNSFELMKYYLMN